jgi:hypothetical protein
VSMWECLAIIECPKDNCVKFYSGYDNCVKWAYNGAHIDFSHFYFFCKFWSGRTIIGANNWANYFL